MNEYDSAFCNVKYVEKDNIVLLTWKKFAQFDEYRKPVTFALELLKEKSDSNLIVDARNGFEDDTEDAEWVKQVFLPELAGTQCNIVCFLMPEVNEIEEEMDMWTQEFGKYFAVVKATDFDSAIIKMHQMLMVTVRYTIKDQKRNEFLQLVKEYGILDASKREPGNFKYDYYFPDDNENDLCLLEIWTNSQAQLYHGQTEHYQKLQELKKQFVEKVQLKKYRIHDWNVQ